MNPHARLSSALLICLLLPITPASAEGQTDDTPARKALGRLLDAMNSMNVETIEAFVKEHFAPPWFEGGASARFYAEAYLRRANEAGSKFTLRQTLHSEPALSAAWSSAPTASSCNSACRSSHSRHTAS